MRDIVVRGVLLCVGGRYVCWNSFKAQFYLGKKSLSEIFSWAYVMGTFGRESAWFERAKQAYPGAKIKYLEDKEAI